MSFVSRTDLLGRGYPTDLVDKIISLGHSIGILRATSKRDLQRDYSTDEIDLIKSKIDRRPIPADTMDRIRFLSNDTCGLCADGNGTRPFQIHHVHPHHLTQDDTLDNLLLVCPTHHVVIHKNDIVQIEQRRIRSRWYVHAEIARGYAARGLPFPFEQFEALDFDGPSNMAALLELRPADPSTARELARNALGRRIRDAAETSGFVVLSGRPGSGKSTLAVGVAGLLAESGRKVFRYRPPTTGDLRAAVSEVLTFLGTAVVPSVLILDDAGGTGSALSLDDLQSIGGAVGGPTLVLATLKSVSNQSDFLAEVHLRHHLLEVDWSEIRPHVRSFLESHEAEVVAILQTLRQDPGFAQVGFDVLTRSLSSAISFYESQAQSVWQFMFLLSGGSGHVARDLASYIAEDRSDLPLLCAAIEQIADVERPVTPDEVVFALQGLDPAGYPPVTADWVRSVFERLAARRIVVRVREAYRPIHREWSRALIEAALQNPRSHQPSSNLLARDFCATPPSPRRLFVLWSWLQHDAHAGYHVRQWIKQRTIDDWANLVRASIRAGIVDFGLCSDQLAMFFPRPPEPVVIAVRENLDTLGQHLENSTPDSWYLLQQILTFVRSLDPTLAAMVMDQWSPDTAATLLRATGPEYFSTVRHLLANIASHSGSWVQRLGAHFTWDDVERFLSSVPQGGFDVVLDVMMVAHSHLGLPFLRSNLARYVDTICRCLHQATLKEIDFDDVLIVYVLEAFPGEMRRIVAALDPVALARDLSGASPRYWGQLLMMSLFARRVGSDFPQRLIDNLNCPQLLDNVRRHGPQHQHQLRLLIWQLSHGSVETRAFLADDMFEPVSRACASASSDERDSILTALDAFQPALARRVAAAVGAQIPTDEQSTTDAKDAFPEGSLLTQVSGGSELISTLEELDRTGQDYDLREHGVWDYSETSG